MFEYYRRLDEINKDYEKNKEKYFKEIAEIVRKYKGKAYIFGSQLKGNAIAASDVDILVEIPCEVYWLEVLTELRMKIRNPKFEFHVHCVKEAEEMKKLIKIYKEID
ncbi:MAG: nucleotidyltransferase domain-containing protein [Acidianus sp.]|uniref:nucleotidyltransferase domain-containing protein n=1 Tax=Acidianus sp. TaxID=1872104 RepID=UPI00397E49F8